MILTKTRVALFWVLSIGVALVSWRFLPFGVEATMSFVAHHLDGRALALYTHIGLAPVALILMPLQFTARLRGHRPRLHRRMGRVYGLVILLAGVAGLSLAAGTTAGPVAGLGFAILALLWLGTTGRAVWLAMQRRIVAHRAWMIRSAALTFAAVTLRLYLPFLEAGFGFDIGYVIVAWLCWVPNLLVAEWLIRRRPRQAPVTA
ncbi:DUF2306 domain-containing protein [Nioella nitratireducens]|uniref:DUF2306 domain-containing protein n=1 Tax=Nioella nitratireducens TaxID=1287720 RepID=UPI0008FD3F26|nr:DUF2306 domain-containing protein [Nioella nitratireducens]